MGKGIVKYRYVILAVFIALIAVSAAFLPTMINKVNYDLTSYLPDDYETSKGYAFLSETFNIHGDVEIGVTATYEEIEQAAKSLDPAGITRYAVGLATLFHKYYNACKIAVEDEALMQARLNLCLAVKQTIVNILTMFKITVPESM